MMQTIEALIDQSGRLHLLEKIELGETRRALVTILEQSEIGENQSTSVSMVGSVEIIDDDLEAGSQQIMEIFNQALLRSSEDLTR